MRLQTGLSLILLALLAGCATAPKPTAPSLASSIDAAISRAPFDRAIWGIRIESDRGEVLYAHNDTTLMIPASNRKLFAAAAVVECLGATGQLATEVWRDGEDLVLKGDGDPSLGSWRYERSGDFDALAERLRERGITRVRNVIADVSRFDADTIPGGWKHGNMGEDYAAPVDAIAWGENEVANNRAVPEPGLHAAEELRNALELRGVAVSGTTLVTRESRSWQERIATIESPFVGQLLMTVLKNSHNLYAEMLLKRIADGTYAGALARERSFLLAEPKLADGSFRFVDGSGLAPDDLVAPETTIRLLRWMNDPARRAFWWQLLAQPNNEGTLRRRLVSLEERLRAKTGTINGVNALSGIIAMPDGSSRYFSIAVNHHLDDGDLAVAAIDRIVEIAAATSPAP